MKVSNGFMAVLFLITVVAGQAVGVLIGLILIAQQSQ